MQKNDPREEEGEADGERDHPRWTEGRAGQGECGTRCAFPRHIEPQTQRTRGAGGGSLPSPAGGLTTACPAAIPPGGGEDKPCS